MQKSLKDGTRGGQIWTGAVMSFPSHQTIYSGTFSTTLPFHDPLYLFFAFPYDMRRIIGESCQHSSCTMLKITNFRIGPVETPGLVHVDGLTQESARETTKLLEENNSRYHIFSTTEDDKGVSSSSVKAAATVRKLHH